MKIIFILFLVCICVFTGLFFSKKYRQRQQFFNAMILLCHKFNVEINFSKEKIKNIFLSFDEKLQSQLFGIDKNYINYLSQQTTLEKEALFKNINFLKEDEKDLLFMFFKSLGKSDLDGQSKEIQTYSSRFENIHVAAQQENKKYGSLSIKLAIIASIFVLILFI